MASILPFIRNKSDFNDEATRLMGEAFNAACKELNDTGHPPSARRSYQRLTKPHSRSPA